MTRDATRVAQTRILWPTVFLVVRGAVTLWFVVDESHAEKARPTMEHGEATGDEQTVEWDVMALQAARGARVPFASG